MCKELHKRIALWSMHLHVYIYIYVRLILLTEQFIVQLEASPRRVA